MTKTNKQREEITHQLKAEVSGLLGIIKSNINDTGQSVLAEQKLGDILELHYQAITQTRKEVLEEVDTELNVVLAEYEERLRPPFKSISEENVTKIRMVIDKVKERIKSLTKEERIK